MDFLVQKRLSYKKLVKTTQKASFCEIYDKRQSALKWILATCFGYLGYRNAKFGTIDGHTGVCAFGRMYLLKASQIAECRGFSIVHGIVDCLWLKKHGSVSEDYEKLCTEVNKKVGRVRF